VRNARFANSSWQQPVLKSVTTKHRYRYMYNVQHVQVICNFISACLVDGHTWSYSCTSLEMQFWFSDKSMDVCHSTTINILNLGDTYSGLHNFFGTNKIFLGLEKAFCLNVSNLFWHTLQKCISGLVWPSSERFVQNVTQSYYHIFMYRSNYSFPRTPQVIKWLVQLSNVKYARLPSRS
jgi:hypothetical protein